jgi:TRAP-type mannitol/chloroaromatic compound transport system permease small subunit
MKTIMALVRVIDKINTWVARAMATLIVPLLGLTMYEVIMRYVVHDPPLWGSQALLLIWFPVALLSGGYVLRIKGHVKLDLLYARWSPRGQAISDVATFAAFLLFTGVLAVVAIEAAWKSTAMRELHMYWAWHGPVYPKRMVIAVAAVLLLVQGMVEFFRNVRTIMGRKDTES